MIQSSLPLQNLCARLPIGRRNLSGFDLSALSSRLLEVVRSGSLNPPNPVLKSLRNKADDCWHPEFRRMLPYHLENAIQSTRTQYSVDLAELEVAITAGVDKETQWKTTLDLLNRIDEIEAPLYQIKEVGQLFSELAALPDQQKQWQEAHRKTRSIRGALRPFTGSKIIYQTLTEMAGSSTDAHFPIYLRLAFERNGLCADEGHPDKRQQLVEIDEKLKSLNRQLQSVVERSGANKSDRLSIVKYMYNIIGLTHLQAQHLGYSTVSSMMMHERNAMSSSVEEVLNQNESLANILRPYVPKASVTLDEEAGAFLPSSKPKAPTDSEKELWIAKQSFKKLVYLDGTIQAIVDFCDSILGINIVENKDASSLGWNQNVRIFDVANKTDGSSIGTIFFDPYNDKYWRSSEASETTMSRLFSIRPNQTRFPVAVIGLSIEPTWDDVPTPLSWKDFQDVLFHFGNALQMLLSQKAKIDNKTPYYLQPSDVSHFLGKFMVLWLYNDGFLERLAQLSQDQFTFQPELMRVLRQEFKKQRATNLMENIFLCTLELAIFTDFDPRGDETLVSLQGRIARKYVPYDMPDSNDLGPMIEIFQCKNLDPKISTNCPVHSEMLACMAYKRFMTTDLQNAGAVEKLGQGIRNLFLSPETSSKEYFESLCDATEISVKSLRDVHDF
ncbi:unnamed protein product [Cylindrotheca closterium]|uniref:Peptidase M3A/M3B catalytic domain-containing protein n=1 Tax=Cylindrotheca closterium TaxID=2856 RepID=A0AAD2G225_9STRA|nr:unnamed protein product [Cylindrotheca closterium]